jgi:hypothetical protein
MQQRDVSNDEAIVSVTYNGQMGDMPSAIPVESTDAQIRAWATESVRTGTIRGIPADRNVNFNDFVIERFPPNAERNYNVIMLRPKATFG